MGDFATLLVFGTAGVIAMGLLLNAFAFIPTEHFPLLRFLDGKYTPVSD